MLLKFLNPLGTSKKTHKAVAVYLSAANLPIHVQYNTITCPFVLLCGESDLKQFGICKVFSDILVDLKDLERNVITVWSETVKGALDCNAGNLGSHGIGGCTENFCRSQIYFQVL